MPDSCKEEILQSNLANLKLQNKLSQLSNSPPQDMKGKALKLIQQASSVSMASNHSQQIISYSKFYIIKSYTEEDVHKAIKYKIWSSTDRGNNILDAAYRSAQLFKQENPDVESEVYLFFSVNKSKHFCGVAKMTSRVNHKQEHQNLWK